MEYNLTDLSVSELVAITNTKRGRIIPADSFTMEINGNGPKMKPSVLAILEGQEVTV